MNRNGKWLKIRQQSISFELDLINFVRFLGENEEDLMLVHEPAPSRKRKADESELEAEEQQEKKNAKRARVSDTPLDEDDDDVIVL